MLNMSAEEIFRYRTNRTSEHENLEGDIRSERPRERFDLNDQRWTIPDILAILRRQFRLISGVILIVLVLAAIYLILAPARYTATASLLTNTTRGLASPTGSSPDTLVDASVVESQIETLKSDKIGLAVIDKLQLWKDPEFIGSGPGLITRFLDAIGLFGPATAPTRDMKRRRAMAVFRSDTEVKGLGHSYVAEIAFTSLDPRKAATIANAIADAYIEDQLGASFANAQRAGAWMQERLAEMRNNAHNAAQAVSDFKSKQGSAAQSANANSAAAAKLRALEAAAQNAKSLYDALLNRYTRVTQFMQQQSFPVTQARVLTQATPPPSKSSPKTATILLLALIAGGTIGVGAALGRETIDTRVRRREQVERQVGLPSLGGLSYLRASGPVGRKGALWSRWWRKYFRAKTSYLMVQSDAPSLLTYDDPFSGNADTLRQIRLSIDRSVDPGGGRLVGIISARGGEGRTTVAFNLAALTAQTGLRTLLLDGDLRNPFLMWSIAPNAEDGLVRVLRSEARLGQVLLTHEFGFDLLGEPWGQLSAHPADILNSRRMAHLLTEMRRCYDYIFVDLPAVLEHVDAAASATLFDAFVLIAEWGHTTLDDLEQVMARSESLAERTVGVVTNKVKPQGAHAF
jgi:capsular exopolysaccharide synthesis family protein